MKLVRSPALHFIALGVVAFGVSRWSSAAFPRVDPDEPFAISRAQIETLRASWLSAHGRFPTDAELGVSIDAQVDDELLVRAARRLGLHRSDPIVRRRLARNVAFATDAEAVDEARLVEEAQELGLDRTDLVVRRRLIQKMKLRVFDEARYPAPGEAELQTYLDAHSERYETPARVRLTHVFLSRDRRGASVEKDAFEVFERLQSEGSSLAKAASLGDPFLHGAELPAHSRWELEKKFGAEFARAALSFAPSASIGWQGPVESSFGFHLVWIHERSEAAPAVLNAVRSQVSEALMRERGEVGLRAMLEELRVTHPIPIVGLGAAVGQER